MRLDVPVALPPVVSHAVRLSTGSIAVSAKRKLVKIVGSQFERRG